MRTAFQNHLFIKLCRLFAEFFFFFWEGKGIAATLTMLERCLMIRRYLLWLFSDSAPKDAFTSITTFVTAGIKLKKM